MANGHGNGDNQFLSNPISICEDWSSVTMVFNQASCQRMAITPAPSSIHISKARSPVQPLIHNVDTRINLQHPPAHICQSFDSSHNPYHLVYA